MGPWLIEPLLHHHLCDTRANEERLGNTKSLQTKRVEQRVHSHEVHTKGLPTLSAICWRNKKPQLKLGSTRGWLMRAIAMIPQIGQSQAGSVVASFP